MSVSLRNFEEGDFEAVQALLTAQIGPELAANELAQPEPLKAFLMMENVFGLVAVDDSNLLGAVFILMEQETSQSVVGLLTRFSVADVPGRSDIAANLVATAMQSLDGNLQLSFAEIPSEAVWAQAACESGGFKVCGFLPHKFQKAARCGGVVYGRLSESAQNLRRPHPALIPSVLDLAVESLKSLGTLEDIESRDDVAAYPTECIYTTTPIDAEVVGTMRQSQTQQESAIFPALQGYQTQLHLPASQPAYLAAKDGDRVIGAMGYVVDPFDRRVQITDMITLEGEPQGFLAAQIFETLSEQVSPDYWEVLVSAHAPRMQKTFDQMGFAPCAYIPCFGVEHGMRSDAIKMVKLNAGYKSETMELTSAGKSAFTLIDTIFREYSVGMAVLKLLRDLRIFQGLGEGELRRVARLFTQKLFKPGEALFEEGTTGQELYVVERGEIEIRTKNGSMLLGTIRNGAVLGEIAFLNNEPRTARAVSKSATIVRVIHRTDFDRLTQRELHLGRVFFQNVAMDLAEKLKQTVVKSKSS